MIYLESKIVDPYWNLALEQYLFETVGQTADCFMLWQNKGSIIIGRHQNTMEEINRAFVEANNIPVVRRLSGGGAVYHDLGNLNFTFITSQNQDSQLHMQSFCTPVIQTLNQLGVSAEISGRNDLTIQSRKFSGNSQYVKGGRLLHHGTLMFSSELEVLEKALRVQKDKMISKGIKSVRDRVTNIRDHLPNPVSLLEFKELLKQNILSSVIVSPYILSDYDFSEIQRIADERYHTWAWNYGESPSCTISRKKYFQGCGFVEVRIVIQHGCISDLKFYGDFLGEAPPEELAEEFLGIPFPSQNFKQKLRSLPVQNYFYHINHEELLQLFD